MCGGGGSPPPPPMPSGTEEQLRQKQLDLLNEQDRLNKMFQPIQATELGYRPIYGVDPKLTELEAKIDAAQTPEEKMRYQIEYTNAGFDKNKGPVILGYEKSPERAAEEAELREINKLQLQTSKRASQSLNEYLDSLDTPEAKAAVAKQREIEAQQREIALKQGERQKLALEGQLPLSEGTRQRKLEEFNLLKERMGRVGNPIIGDTPEEAYSLTTSGAQSLDLFKKRYGALEDQERRGELDSGGSLYLQSVGLTGDIGNRNLGAMQGFSGPGGYGSVNPTFTRGNPFANQNYNLISGYGNAMSPYAQDRALQYQQGVDASSYNAAQKAGTMQLIGQGAGLATSAAFLLSSKKAKKNIVSLTGEGSATKKLSKAKLYEFNYKNERDGSKKHIGVMAEEAPEEVRSGDGRMIDIGSYLGLLTASVKELDRRINKEA